RAEIVVSVRRHREERGRAGVRRRQIFGDQGSQRIRALGRGGPVGGERGKRAQRRRAQRRERETPTRSAPTEAVGRHRATFSVQRGYTPSVRQPIPDSAPLR